jgi:hypothetical protein
MKLYKGMKRFEEWCIISIIIVISIIIKDTMFIVKLWNRVFTVNTLIVADLP